MSIQEENIRFFNRLSKHYDRSIFKFSLNLIFKRMLNEVRIKNNSEILDVGCGTGNFLELISENKTLKLHGIDISKEMLKIARKKLNRRASLKLAYVEKLKGSKKFDYIFSTESFHHFANQEKAMENFYKLLKHQGKLVIVDFDFGRFANYIFHTYEPGNTKMNSKKDFYNLFNKHGFKDIRQKRILFFAVMTIGIKPKLS
jgi:ubiquinone/menaquinone biosynthesis C-methylase UbiE